MEFVEDHGRFGLVDAEDVIEREVVDKASSRRDVAMTYRLAMESERKGLSHPDWGRINRAILTRWSPSGLEHIKKLAWSGACFDGAARA